MTCEQYDEMLAYDQIWGLGFSKPLKSFFKRLFAHVLASQGYEFDDDDLDWKPDTTDPDTGHLERVM